MPEGRRRLQVLGGFFRRLFSFARSSQPTTLQSSTSCRLPVSEIPLPFGPAPWTSCVESLTSALRISEIPLPFGPAPCTSCLYARAVGSSEAATCDVENTADDINLIEVPAAVAEESSVSVEKAKDTATEVPAECSSKNFKPYLLTGKYAPKTPSPLLCAPPGARTTTSPEDERLHPVSRRGLIDLRRCVHEVSYLQLSGSVRLARQLSRQVSHVLRKDEPTPSESGARRYVRDTVEVGTLLALRRAHFVAMAHRKFDSAR